MKAVVELTNPARGMVGARLDNGDYVMIEILDTDQPEKGDVLSNPDFTSLGSETVRNMTQESKLDVFVQDICTRDYLIKNGFLSALFKLLALCTNPYEDLLYFSSTLISVTALLRAASVSCGICYLPYLFYLD